MAFTTYAAYVAALAAMNITGVTTEFSEPPRQLHTAQLPAQFPRLPTGENGIVAFSSATGLSSATCELVIVIEPVQQNLQSVNYALALTLLDNTETALATNAAAFGLDGWTLEVQRSPLGDGTVYWTLVATVEASG